MIKGDQDGPTAGRWAGSDQREARREAILDTTLALLEERGYDGTSMQRVAEAAHTSKETLYSWFGDKAGLFEALVGREAQSMNQALVATLEADHPRGAPSDFLVRFGVDVLSLLLGPRSLSINRAAIAAATTSPELGRILAAKGRETTRPLVERYLAAEHAAGRLRTPDTGEAFGGTMGLLVRDLQVRMLFGIGGALGDEERQRRAEAAVAAFLTLYRGPQRPA